MRLPAWPGGSSILSQFLLIVRRSALYKTLGARRPDPFRTALHHGSPCDDRGKESPSSLPDAGKEAPPMRSRLVPAVWLLVLGIAGSVALSLLSGQEIKQPPT